MAGRQRATVKAKVVLLGEGAVGKTSIVLRYVENKFNDKHLQTLQASFVQKNLNVGDKRIQLSIWDTAGQERYHALGPIYYRDSQGAIVVYDITDEDSFQKAKNWIKELRKMLGDDIVVCVVGNKIDLEKNRTVSKSEAESYAQSVGAVHYQASAKQNKGIQELFLDLSKRILDSTSNGGGGGGAAAATSHVSESRPTFASQANNRRSIIVADDLSASQTNSEGKGGGGGCC